MPSGSSVELSWGALGAPREISLTESHIPPAQRIDIGNFVHGWLKKLVVALTLNRTLNFANTLEKRSDLRGTPVHALLGCFPGVGVAILPQLVEPMRSIWRDGTEAMRAHSGQIDADPMCCARTRSVRALELARPIVAAALRSAFKRCGISRRRVPAMLYAPQGSDPSLAMGGARLHAEATAPQSTDCAPNFRDSQLRVML